MPKGNAKTWEQHKEECEAIAKPGITILDYIGEWKGCKTKLKCMCAKHGEWVTTTINKFKTIGGHCPQCKKSQAVLKRCSTWEKEKPLCEAAAKPGITVLGFIEPWVGEGKTKLLCNCELHGEWKTTNVKNFKSGSSCPACAKQTYGMYRKKSDEEVTEFLLSSARFHPETKFYRSGRKNNEGTSIYFGYVCPVCSKDEITQAGLCTGTFEATLQQLTSGIVPCRCSKYARLTPEQWAFKISKQLDVMGYTFVGWANPESITGRSKVHYLCPHHGLQTGVANLIILKQYGCSLCAGHDQQECYINIVFDGDVPVACKLGIAKSSKRRLTMQNSKNALQMKQSAVWKFPSVEACKLAEKTCLTELECGILSNRELQDGWTETTSTANYAKIVEIYERFGGVKK